MPFIRELCSPSHNEHGVTIKIRFFFQKKEKEKHYISADPVSFDHVGANGYGANKCHGMTLTL